MFASLVTALTTAAWITAATPVIPVATSPEILLTFDDGPAAGKTTQVLDILDEHHIKAVFFVTGWRLRAESDRGEESRSLLREVIKRGHVVGNHTVNHYYLCGNTYFKRATQEIEENAALIEQAIGAKPQLFRTPYGSHCPKLNQLLIGLGISPVGWDIDSSDWKLRNSQKIFTRVTSQLKHLEGRKIVLFHDVHAETVKALPKILDWIDKENQRREADGQLPIKIIGYDYLMPRQQHVEADIALPDWMSRIWQRVQNQNLWSDPLGFLLWPALVWNEKGG